MHYKHYIKGVYNFVKIIVFFVLQTVTLYKYKIVLLNPLLWMTKGIKNKYKLIFVN